MLYSLFFHTLGWSALASPGIRAALALATAFAIALALGRPTIAWLKRQRIGEKTEKTPIEDEALRRSISAKSGTPTMGGLFLVPALLGACLLWGDLADKGMQAAVICVAGLAALGVMDDVMKLRSRARKDRGLKVRYKLLVQALIGAGAAAVLVRLGATAWAERVAAASPSLHLTPQLAGLIFLAWGTLLVMTMSNATNVTDGMDGLLAGLAPLAAVAVGAAALLGPVGAEMGVLCGALAGACLGFLIYNRHPAQVFMGDTGSLALGGALAIAALASRQDVVLLVAGVIFLAEFGSSVLQIGAYQIFGRRVLPIAPMHHIFQRQGHAESRIVHGFYLGGVAAAMAGLGLLLM